jgi:POT family proton-dependent oligopeptide transporter
MSHNTATKDASDRAFLGHPIGLGYISFTEAWERFSYYGMQTLLVLYMVNQLLLPGHVEHIAGFAAFRALLEGVYGHKLSTVALSSAIFGAYAGFVYLTPIVGGLIADRWLGKTATITIGALLMALGHFLMAFDVSFLLALLCLLCGVGCFKGNLASQVSALYADADLRRADAYQIYYLFINAAVIVAPLVTGTLGQGYGWHYGFGAAGLGMLIGLVVYLSGRKYLPKERIGKGGNQPDSPHPVQAPLSAKERRAVYVLLALLPVLAIGSVGNQQIFNSYMLWVPANIDLVFFGRTMPSTWLISLDATVSISALFLSLIFWRWWGKRYDEPSEIIKMTIGLVLSAAGMACIAMAGVFATAGHKAGIGWILGFEVLNSLGFANLFPVGIALFARASPKAVAGTLLGVYYLHLFACNNFVGWLGGLMERMPGVQFWLLHVGLIGGAALLMFIIAKLFGRYLVGEAAEPAA